MRNIGIILAGGIGSRFKGNIPKQYCLLKGKELIYYSIEAFKKSILLDDFVVVLDKHEYDQRYIERKYNVKTIVGGNSRNQSFMNALNYINTHYPECDKIIENNAACPLINPFIIDLYLDKLDTYDYVQSAYYITDALCSFSKKRNVDRKDFFFVQSPDAYRFKTLYKYFDPDSVNGHPASHLPSWVKGLNFFDFQPNIKITYPYDIKVAEAIMNYLDSTRNNK